MSASELLIAVVIVTLLVTVFLLGASYLNRKIGGRGRPPVSESGGDGWYFVRFYPGGSPDTEA